MYKTGKADLKVCGMSHAATSRREAVDQNPRKFSHKNRETENRMYSSATQMRTCATMPGRCCPGHGVAVAGEQVNPLLSTKSPKQVSVWKTRMLASGVQQAGQFRYIQVRAWALTGGAGHFGEEIPVPTLYIFKTLSHTLNPESPSLQLEALRSLRSKTLGSLSPLTNYWDART